MDFFKKEWKNIIFSICLIGIIVFLFQVNSQLESLQQQNAKIISTFDTIETVTVGTDAGLNKMAKSVEKIENNVDYIVKKVRRR